MGHKFNIKNKRFRKDLEIHQPLIDQNLLSLMREFKSQVFTSVERKNFDDLKQFLKKLPLQENLQKELNNKLNLLDRVELSMLIEEFLKKEEFVSSFNILVGGEKIWIHMDVVQEFLLFIKELSFHLQEASDSQKKLYMVGLYEDNNQRIDFYYPGWNPEELLSELINKSEYIFKLLKFEFRHYHGKILLEIKLPVFGDKKAFLKFLSGGEIYAIPHDWIEKTQFLSIKPNQESIYIVENFELKESTHFPKHGKLAINLNSQTKENSWILVDDIYGKFYVDLEIHQLDERIKVIDNEKIFFINNFSRFKLKIAS